MTGRGPWIDSHCHLADERFDQSRERQVAAAMDLGIKFFMQGGVGPEDWKKQIELGKTFPLGLCFGLHPYWIAAHSEGECEVALDELALILDRALALGELGLDFRPHIMKDSQDRQIQFFEDQLALAEAARKPLVLHLVQAHEEALKIFRIWGVPTKKGMVHSFNGSWAVAQDLLNLGFCLSFGGPLVRLKNEKLKQAARECPLEMLMIETDSPDQSPDVYKGQLNPPSSLWLVAEEMGRLKGMTAAAVLDISSNNFRRVFGGP